MPQTFDNDDLRIDLENEISSLRDSLLAEQKAHLRTARMALWYLRRIQLLEREQYRMRDPERTIVCDIIANGQLLPDPNNTRYGTHNSTDIGDSRAHRIDGISLTRPVDD